MISGPFLTDLDSRAAIKGSRDPLGIQSIWTRFGRHVVGNLSTVSNSVRDFTILLLGYYFAARVAESAGPGTEPATFLKWEQLASYARGKVNEDWQFRGTERVRQNLDEGKPVTLSAQPVHQILSSQKLYGLWGLYSVPARASGFLDGVPARLTVPALEMVEQFYLPRLSKAGFHEGKRIVELLAQERVRIDPDGAHEKLLAAIAGLLLQFTTLERKFYRSHLLLGGSQDSTEGRQRQLAELLETELTEAQFPWSPVSVTALAKEAESRGEMWHPLAFRLRRIAVAETFLAPASALFGHLLGCDDVATAEIAKRIKRAWGDRVTTVLVREVTELKAELGNGDDNAGQRWVEIGQSIAEGDYKTLITILLQQNKVVMQSRGGSAWIEEQNGKLRVRMSEERGALPDRSKLRTLWRFPYFLDSLCSVAFALKENGHE